MLYAARVLVPSLARWLLGLGITAALTANMAQGSSHGPVGAVVAAWPAVSLVGSYAPGLAHPHVWHSRTRAAGRASWRAPNETFCTPADEATDAGSGQLCRTTARRRDARVVQARACLGSWRLWLAVPTVRASDIEL